MNADTINAYIRANWRHRSDPQMAKHLGLSPSQVERRRQKLGLFKGASSSVDTLKNRELLLARWHKVRTDEIAQEMGCHRGSVSKLAATMRLGKNRASAKSGGARPIKTWESGWPEPKGPTQEAVEWAKRQAELLRQAGNPRMYWPMEPRLILGMAEEMRGE